jgi:RNA-directed DNA polymerase
MRLSSMPQLGEYFEHLAFEGMVSTCDPNAFGKVLECVVGFFDTVKFDRLMRLLARRISDKRVLRLIGAYLRAGVKLRDGKV